MNNLPRSSRVMLILGIVAILAGGLLSAGFAHDPNRFMMWCVAFLVLVVGVAQVVIGALAKNWQPGVKSWHAWVAVVSYNLGSGTIIIGRSLKESFEKPAELLVLSGTLVFMLAVLQVLLAVKLTRRWQAIVFYVTTVILLIGSLVGLLLSFG